MMSSTNTIDIVLIFRAFVEDHDVCRCTKMDTKIVARAMAAAISLMFGYYRQEIIGTEPQLKLTTAIYTNCFTYDIYSMRISK